MTLYLLLALILALCSMVYELALGQALSALLGNSVLRYSVTVGLYLASLGVGALLASIQKDEEGDYARKQFRRLIYVELLLSLIGGLAAITSFLIFDVTGGTLLFSIICHSIIILIGVLSGFELPLLIDIASGDYEDHEEPLLGANYIGAFLGCMIFALWFFPTVGLFLTTVTLAIMNSLAGLSIYVKYKRSFSTDTAVNLAALAQSAVFFLMIYLYSDMSSISEAIMQQYVGM